MKLKSIMLLSLVVILMSIPSLVSSQSFYDSQTSVSSVNIGFNDFTMSGLGISQEKRPFPRAWAIVLNIIPCFGVGSYVQGDNFAGNIQLTMSIVGFTLGSILVTYGKVGQHTEGGSVLKGHEIWLGWTLMGLGFGGSMIYGIIAATLYNPNASKTSDEPSDGSSDGSSDGTSTNDNDDSSDDSSNDLNNNTSVFFTGTGICIRFDF